MAKNKKSFLLYIDQIYTVEKLTDEQAGKLYKHLLRYVNDLNPDAPDQLTEIVFEPIKQQLKRDLKRYEGICLKNRDNVNLRWNKKDTTVYDRIRTDTKHTDNDNDNDIDNDKEIKKRKRSSFKAPMVEELKKYFDDNGYSEASAIKAFNYYSVADWHDSKGNKIKNWKQKMQSVWFKDENKKKPAFIMP